MTEWVFFRKEWRRIPLCGVGYLFFVKGGAGENVSAGKPLFKLADLSRVYVRAYFTTAQLSGLKLGDKLSVFPDDGSLRLGMYAYLRK